MYLSESKQYFMVYTWSLDNIKRQAHLADIQYKGFKDLAHAEQYAIKKSTNDSIISINERKMTYDEFKKEKKVYIIGKTHTYYKPPFIFSVKKSN